MNDTLLSCRRGMQSPKIHARVVHTCFQWLFHHVFSMPLWCGKPCGKAVGNLVGILWKVTLEKNIDPQFDNIADSMWLQGFFSTIFVILQNAQKQGVKM